MALDYITDPTGIFRRVGKLIKYIDAHAGDAATLDAELKAIADKFELSDLTPQILGLYGDYAAFKDATTTTRQQLSTYADNVLTDRDTVLEELNLASGDALTVLIELWRKMAVDAQTVNASVVTIGVLSMSGTPVGNGTILLTKLMDGVTPPVRGGPSILQYANRNSELAVPIETMTFTCTRDSGSGATEGAEQFDWTGELADQPFGWQDEGSGPGPSLTVANGTSIVQNGGFESWTSGVLASWTIDSGAPRIGQETTTVYRGANALRFDGDGATASIAISQVPSGMIPLRAYAVSVFMRGTSIPAAGTFEVLFTGTGYTAGSTEKVSVPAASVPVTFTRYSFIVVTPVALPSDWKLNVRVTGTLSNAVSLFIDNLTVQEVTYHGGIGAAIVPGSIPFRVGDRFVLGLTNSEGVIQRFLRRRYQLQLPSDNAGAETVLDSLAT